MSSDQQLAVVVAGVCVLAVLILVVARRRTRTPREPVTSEPGKVVLARTHDGTQFQGALVEMGGRDGYLTLAGPIVFRRAGGEAETMPPVWDRLALAVADVTEVWTRAAPPAPTVATETAPDHVDAADEAPPSASDGDDVPRRRHSRRARRVAPATS